MSAVTGSLRLAGVLAVVLAAQACEKKAADTGAAMDTSMMATTPAAAPAAPAELKAQSDAMLATWNQEDASKVAAFFTADATAHVDDSTYTGIADITNKWLKPGLPTVSDVAVSGQAYSGSGDTMTESGSFTEQVTLPKKAPSPVAGTYTVTWTKVGADWKVKDLTVHSNAPAMAPAPT